MVDHPDRRHLEDVLDRHLFLERRDGAANLARVGDRPEHHLGLGRRRDDVGRDAADDQADRIVRLSEHRIGRQLDRRSATSASISLSMADSPSSGYDECAARPAARSLSRRMPRVASAEPAVGRLAVDQILAAVGRRGVVRDARAVAATLFADHEQQADARFAVARSRSARGDLRRQNAFGVARSAAEDPAVLDAALEERRHAVVVGREHHRRTSRPSRAR